MSDFSDDAQREWGIAKAEGKLDDTSKADELRNLIKQLPRPQSSANFHIQAELEDIVNLITAHSNEAQRELLDRLIASSDVVTDHDLMATGVTKDEYVNLSVIDAERKRLEGTTDD